MYARLSPTDEKGALLFMGMIEDVLGLFLYDLQSKNNAKYQIKFVGSFMSQGRDPYKLGKSGTFRIHRSEVL